MLEQQVTVSHDHRTFFQSMESSQGLHICNGFPQSSHVGVFQGIKWQAGPKQVICQSLRTEAFVAHHSDASTLFEQPLLDLHMMILQRLFRAKLVRPAFCLLKLFEQTRSLISDNTGISIAIADGKILVQQTCQKHVVLSVSSR